MAGLAGDRRSAAGTDPPAVSSGVSERDGAQPHVALRAVSKHFGGALALESVSLDIQRGQVHALVGENGAGKSTLGKIVAGGIRADSGDVLVDGDAVAFRSPREALAHGIAAITQELMVVPGLTVAENVFLGVEPRTRGWVRRRQLRSRYGELAAAAGFDLPGDRLAGTMRIAEQQQIEILRALARDARLIVMDEPSAALSGPDVDRLHEIIRSLAESGKTVLLVSHFLREVLELSDTLTVLRDGRVIRTAAAPQETQASLIQAMLGRPLESAFPTKSPPRDGAPVAMAVENVVARGVNGVSLQLREGEILGLAGLVGAGRTELARAIFGADRRRSGRVILAGTDLIGGGPRGSLRSRLGMIPESRRDEGLLFSRSVVENVTLSSLARHSRGGILNHGSERRAAGEMLEQVELTGATGASRVSTLSGGNQQKVLFARLLMSRPRVLIADEPTRGVDVGAKRAIYDLLVALAQQGTAVLLISSELEEVLGLAHRVLVMRQGRVVKELIGGEMSESTILAAAFADHGEVKDAA